jgi:exodeoxyribonuclease-3
MRIATWNVNSLNARLDKVTWWLDRARPDVLLMQETKLSDENAPFDELARHGFELAHHGEGRWNGVAIASRVGLSNVVTNFGVPLGAVAADDAPDDEPLNEARMISADCDGIRVASVYAPNGRSLDSEFYHAKLKWFGRLARWLQERQSRDAALVLAGDFNVAPTDEDVWDPAACHGGTHVSLPERDAFAALTGWGLVDAFRRLHSEPERFTWWDYRAGRFQRNEGMRIDHVLLSAPLAERLVRADVDREARKGKPTPSDHAPLFVDIDEPGSEIDAGWDRVDDRAKKRRAAQGR